MNGFQREKFESCWLDCLSSLVVFPDMWFPRDPAHALLFIGGQCPHSVFSSRHHLAGPNERGATSWVRQAFLLGFTMSYYLAGAMWCQVTVQGQPQCRSSEGPVLGQVQVKAPWGQRLLLLLAVVSTCTKKRWPALLSDKRKMTRLVWMEREVPEAGYIVIYHNNSRY